MTVIFPSVIFKIALVMELLRLQQKNQIPSQVTAEDMINIILEQSKNTLRERQVSMVHHYSLIITLIN